MSGPSLGRRLLADVLPVVLIAAVLVAGIYLAFGGFRLDQGFSQRTLATVESGAPVPAEVGDLVEQAFRVTNVSDAPLRLLGAKTSCDCTLADSDFPVDLAPGAITIVRLQMKVGTPDLGGTYEQQATLLLNRRGRVAPLIITADVDPSP